MEEMVLVRLLLEPDVRFPFLETTPGSEGMLIDAYNYSIINDGIASLDMFGYIDYTDDFSILGKRRVGFCEVYDPKNRLGLGAFGRLRQC